MGSLDSLLARRVMGRLYSLLARRVMDRLDSLPTRTESYGNWTGWNG